MERNWITDMECLESGPPPVSIEDRTVVGPDDRGLNSTNHIPEVGGSRKPVNCVPLYDDTLNSVLLRWAWDDGGCWIGCRLRVLREFSVRGPSPGF